MAEDGNFYRPKWCPDKTCFCLCSFADRLCWGRLSKLQVDPDVSDDPDDPPLKNTHNFSMGSDDDHQVNDEDAYYIMRGFQTLRQDVIDNKLYCPPGMGDTYDIGRLPLR